MGFCLEKGEHTSSTRRMSLTRLSLTDRLSIALDIARALDYPAIRGLIQPSFSGILPQYRPCTHPRLMFYSYGVLLLALVTGLNSIQGSVTLAEWDRGVGGRVMMYEVWAYLSGSKT
ncbi:hypothetical protein NC651_012031 [Populus alba x Populus x berolinensis]|nr:hypothetical protein NC651_012031 [Populus alba x Populus x berolinensis]